MLRKIFELNTLVATNLNEKNVDEFLSVYKRFENDLRKIIEKTELKVQAPIWERFSTMTEEEIWQEFSNSEKYPDLNSIKQAVKGYIDMKKVSKVKTRETLIKHIINTYRRGEFISKIGREEKDKNESKKRV